MKRFTRQQPRGTSVLPPLADQTPATTNGRPRPQPRPPGLGIPASPCTRTYAAGEALMPALTITPLALRRPTSTGSHGSFSGSHTTPTFRLVPECSPSHIHHVAHKAGNATPTFRLVPECSPSHIHHVAHKAGNATPTFRLVPECSPSHIHHVAHKAGKNAAAILVAPDTDLADLDLDADPKSDKPVPVELADRAGGGDDLFRSTGPLTPPDRLAVLSPRTRSPWSRSPDRMNASARSSGSGATSDGQYITVTVTGRTSVFSTSTTGGHSVEPLSSPSPDGAYEIVPPIPPEATLWAGLEAARSAGHGMLNNHAEARKYEPNHMHHNDRVPQQARADRRRMPATARGQPRRRSKSVPLLALPTTNRPVPVPPPRQLSPSPSSYRLALGAATPSRSAWSPRPWSQGSPPSPRSSPSPRPQRIFDVLRPRSKTVPAASSGGDRGRRGNAGAGACAGAGCDGAPHTAPPPPCPFATVAEPCLVSPPPLPPTERSFDGFVHQLEMLKLAGSIEPASPKFRRNAMRDSEQIPPQTSDLAELEVDAAQHRKRHGHRHFNHHGHGHGHSHSHSRHLLHLRLPRFRRKGKSVS